MGRPKKDRTQPQGARKASRDEVARHAGVSIHTVHRMFANPDAVAEKTRKRINEAALELGYSPNVSGRALITGKTGTVALVLLAHRLHGEMLGATFDGFYHTLVEHDLKVLVSVVPDDVSQETWAQQLVTGGLCDAIALHAETLSRESARTMENLNVPVTLLYYPIHESDGIALGSVTFDNVSGVQQAVRHLVTMGHRSIAYLGGTPGWGDSEDREKGFRSAMAEAGLGIRDDWMAPCRFDDAMESARDAFDRIFSQPGQRPTAFACASDFLACGVINAARHWGFRVPADLSVTGFDNGMWTPCYNPPLTTVKYSGAEIGAQAAQTILERYHDMTQRPRNIIVSTQLVVRESSGPAPQCSNA